MERRYFTTFRKTLKGKWTSLSKAERRRIAKAMALLRDPRNLPLSRRNGMKALVGGGGGPYGIEDQFVAAELGKRGTLRVPK